MNLVKNKQTLQFDENFYYSERQMFGILCLG